MREEEEAGPWPLGRVWRWSGGWGRVSSSLYVPYWERWRENGMVALKTGEGLIGQDKVAFDMKKAKRDVRVDREERQRWREIINM